METQSLASNGGSELQMPATSAAIEVPVSSVSDPRETLRHLPDAPIDTRWHLMAALAATLVLIIAFVRPLIGIAFYAAHSELHSHILLVPLVSGYLLFIRWSKLSKTYSFSIGWALGSLFIGAAALIAARIESGSVSRNDYLALMAFSFLCFVITGGFLFLGRKWIWTAAFPLFFLIFMVPMPDIVVNTLETGSKVASAEAASLFFDMTGTPVMRGGTTFHLPNITIQVAQECSGIRSSWVLLITGLLAANLFLKSTWRRALLVGLVIPLGLIRNGFRVFVIGTLCIHYGPEMIHSIIHRRGGPAFFVLSLIPLFLLLVWLRREERGPRQATPSRSNLDCTY